MIICLGKLHVELQKTFLYAFERRYPQASFQVSEDPKGELYLNIQGIDDESSVKNFTSEFLNQVGSMAGRIKTKILWKNDLDLIPIINGDSISSVGVHSTDLPGVYLEGELLATWVSILDQICLEFARKFNAEEIRIPSLLTQDHLEKAGYWKREEQQISIVQPRHGSPQSVCCLSPAACLPLYPVVERMLEVNTVFTSKCSVFRWEGGVFPQGDPLSRLWEYQVREIVFFGSAGFLKEVRDKFSNFTKNLMEELGLPSSLQVATDCFFHPESANMALYQLMNETKYELKVHFEGNDLAVSSFNYHQNHFVEAFKISKNADMQSACIGFGLQRLAYACLSSSISSNKLTLHKAKSIIELITKSQF